jgi:hypothetical protein
MAITKIWSVSKKLDKVISYVGNKEKTTKKDFDNDMEQVVYYAVNPKKTEKQVYVSYINCNERYPLKQMQATKKKYNKKDGIIAFHAVQSFAEKEVTPQLAHEIGLKLANEMWGDKFEVIVTTHLNTNHIHNHFVINSVSYKDGLKYYDTKESYALLRSTSDAICEEYQLLTIKNNKNKNGKIDYDRFMIKHQKNSYYTTTKEDIDRAIKQAYSYQDFESIMKMMDYTLTYRAKKLSVCRKGYTRNIRVARAYGKNYEIKEIERRVVEEYEVRVPFQEEYSRAYKPKKRMQYKKLKSKKTKFQKMYLCYLYKLRILQYKNKYRPISKEGREQVKQMERYSNEYKFLSSRNITAIQELITYKETILEEIKSLKKENKSIEYELSKKDTPKEMITQLMSDRKRANEKIRFLRKELEECSNIIVDISTIDETEVEKEFNGKEIDVNEYIRRNR